MFSSTFLDLISVISTSWLLLFFSLLFLIILLKSFLTVESSSLLLFFWWEEAWLADYVFIIAALDLFF